MGVTPGIIYATDATGWTSFTASGTPQNGYNTGPPASGNTMVIFVSSAGSDSPSATEGSSTTPYLTITKGISRMRSGEADWCLLRKGDTFAEQITLANNNTGKSATEPQVFSCYDPGLGNPMVVDPPTGGARPILVPDVSNNFGVTTAGAGGFYLGANFVAFVGWDIYNRTRDPDSGSYDPTHVNDQITALTIERPNQWILIEDCAFRWANQGIGLAPQFFYDYWFVISSSGTVHPGDIYSNNGALFYVYGNQTFTGSVPLLTQRLRSSGAPSSSGTLTKVSGNAGSPATFTFTSVSNPGFNANATVRRCQLLNNASIHTNGGDGSHTGQTINMVWAENCIDHNGWIYGSTISFIISPAASVTPTAGAVYTPNSPTIGFSSVAITAVYTFTLSSPSTAVATAGSTFTNNGQTFTVIPGGDIPNGGTTLVCFGTGAPTASGTLTLATPSFTYTVTTATSTVVTCTKNQSVALGIASGTLFKTSGTGDSSLTFTQITDTVAGQYGFSHNLYHSQFADEYDNSGYCDGISHLGNIHSRASEDEQQRRSGTMSNGLFLYCPVVQTSGLSNDYIIDSCVVLEPNSTAGFNQAQGIFAQQAPHYDRGNATVTNNIIAHGKLGTMGPAIGINSSPSGYVDGNIVYDWPGGNTVQNIDGGILSYGSITNPGSGASAVTFTGFVDDGSTSPTPSGIAGNVLTVTSITGTPLKVNQRITGTGLLADTYIIQQFTGTIGGTGTYGLYMDQRNTAPANAIVAASTTMTIDAYYCNMVYAPGHSGSGTGTTTAYLTLSGGGIGTVTFFPANAFIGWGPGSLYAVGDVLTTNDIPGLVNFTVLVGSVRNTTVTGNNKFYATGITNLPGDKGFPDPGRTIERYDAEVLGGPGTFDHFIGLARANNKSNWDPRLTADVINDWIQEGFGIFESVPTSPPPGLGFSHWPHVHKQHVGLG